jgi:uncharacterized protein (DUF2147 family)
MRLKITLIGAVAALTAIASYPASSQTAAVPLPPAKPSSHAATTTPAKPTPASAKPAQPPNTVAGFWAQMGDDGKVGGWFYFLEKDGLYEGRLVKLMKRPGDPDTMPMPTCDKCEGDQKGAPLLGLTIIKGMKRSGHKYEEGSIMDPRDGTVYHAQMEMSPDGQKLFVRGYLGIPLLGQTQTWTRLPDNSIAAKDIPKDSHTPGLTDSQSQQPQDQQQ